MAGAWTGSPFLVRPCSFGTIACPVLYGREGRIDSVARRGGPRSPNPRTPSLIGRAPSGSWGPIEPLSKAGSPIELFLSNPTTSPVPKGSPSGSRFGWEDLLADQDENLACALADARALHVSSRRHGCRHCSQVRAHDLVRTPWTPTRTEKNGNAKRTQA
eukprot:scaffold177_cov334-Pavlova_lutheri.AAC.74